MSNRPNRRRRHSTPEGNAPASADQVEAPEPSADQLPVVAENKDAKEDDKKKGRPPRKEKSITLKELALLAKAQGCQSAAGARALLQKAAPDRSSALALMQVAIRKAQSESRKRVLVRDVEVVVGVLAELRRCVGGKVDSLGKVERNRNRDCSQVPEGTCEMKKEEERIGSTCLGRRSEAGLVSMKENRCAQFCSGRASREEKSRRSPQGLVNWPWNVYERRERLSFFPAAGRVRAKASDRRAWSSRPSSRRA